MRPILALWVAAVSVVQAAYWMEDIKHQGIAPFSPADGYEVFRNVKEWGAKGDGVTDDTAAINAAISGGGRCGGHSCTGSTTTPAVVYFPPGTYLVSKPIVGFYYTNMIGDPTDMPVIKATSDFPRSAQALFDANPYLSNGKLNFQSTNTFFRQVRNLVFDISNVPVTANAIHWPSSQATLIQNCVFKMSAQPEDTHTGIFMEEGSGGTMADLVFYGGKYGARLGNQQYTMRNLTFYGSDTAIKQFWNWGWTYKSLTVVNCRIGIDVSSTAVGSVTLLDSLFLNVTKALITGRAPGNTTGLGSLVVENVGYENVPIVLETADGKPLLLGDPNGIVYDYGYIRGNTYAPNGPLLVEGRELAFSQPSHLKSGGRYYERSKPNYEDVPASDFVSARDYGAVGDGKADDTQALNTLFQDVAGTSSIVFLDAGYYNVKDTIIVPPRTRIVGEGLASVILSVGEKFSDPNKPRPVVQIGRPGDTGFVEMSDIIVSTQGPTAGAIMIQYNLETPVSDDACSIRSGQPPSGLFDVHIRIGGFTGSNLQLAQCLKPPSQPSYVNPSCIAAHTGMHITPTARNVYMENNWIWVADHDIDDYDATQISVFAARGLLIEGASRVWLVGSSVEHFAMYQYQLVNATDVWMGQIQTETPYYQPNPVAPVPFTKRNEALRDPDFEADCKDAPELPGDPPCAMAWGLRVLGSKNVVVFGAGLYSFFNNYSTTCSTVEAGENCQARILSIESGPVGDDGTGNGTVEIYNLNTIGSVSMITQDKTDMAIWNETRAEFASTLAVFKSFKGDESV
ncbi:hypothetical protein VTJ49DRAFT_6643 [Mycothermus thermophilus]|uniref:Rhamnogalacturonase A/B/Epimerase-like pectate lyase domain-containing protein n=1 Tax=Humicola insolens TaxID=85995 RepID=A0ABR3VIU8_HUMIN